MCDQAIKEDSSSLQFIPDWFVTRKWVWMWCNDYYDGDGDHWDNDDDDDEDKFFGWYDGYQNARPRRQRLRKNFYPSPRVPDV